MVRSGCRSQVFLLDSQKASEALEEQEDALSRSDRSIVLLVHPPHTDPLHHRLAAALPPDQTQPVLR